MFHGFWRIAATAVAALGLIAAPACGPAQAAAAAPLRPAALTVDQLLSTLPGGTPLTFHGKPLTLAAVRVLHQALLARFQSAGSLQSSIVQGPLVAVPVRAGLGGLAAAATPAAKAASSSTSAQLHHVSNPVPTGPYDYVAACKQHSVCVYVPDVPTADGIAFSGDGSTFQVYDPLLTPSACRQYGGAMFDGDYSAAVAQGDVAVGPGQTQIPIAACQFVYRTSAHASAFAGNPPAMQAATSKLCTNGFHVDLDPMGAAQITTPAALFSTLHILPSACAVDIYVPS